MRLYVISALVIAFLAILFALQNTNLVTIQLFIWEYRQSLALILLGTLAIGVLIGILISFPAILRRNFKAARIQKQADHLTELVQAKEQTISQESQRVEATRQNYESLLQSLGVIEPTTGLLHHDRLRQAIATQLHHAQQQQAIAQPPNLTVLMFKVRPTLTDGYNANQALAAVARLLQQQASINTWFYSDGQGLFTATIPGLDLKTATRYGEELQAAILENPPTLPTGQPLELDVTVGGAIADAQSTLEANHLIEAAETALEQALQRGRNRLRMLQAS
jgi:GGDEF domain-containing protein